MYRSIKVVSGDIKNAACLRRQVEQEIHKSGLTVGTGAEVDAIAVIGGDGSYLEAMRNLNFPEEPVFGINSGSLGCFQELSMQGIGRFLQQINDNRVRVDERAILAVVDENDKEYGRAINDVVVSRAKSQAMKAQLTIGRGLFAQFIGDGLIVASSQGSTAYAAAAGGPIIEQGVNAMVVVPSNAHDTVMYESLRGPIVVSDEQTVAIKALEKLKRPVRLELDGMTIPQLIEEQIRIRKSKKKLRVLRPENFDFMQHLAHKMIRSSD